ncbi:autophagy-related protein 23-like [Gossypium raimondii]|uniref:autophagy-related protein 23-like n=1 Tax=Gossypium raimondii TaxID=29730 RepID=UPI00227A09BC|nr:autophagy-related protein 23-like [Gossypium raimondii]
MRTPGLGKTSEQWRQEIREEKGKADGWEKKCQEIQLQNKALERNLLESRSETDELKPRIAEPERSLHRYRNRNTAVELRASLNKIEETNKRVEELDAALQDYEMRVEFFEANEERQKEQLHYYQSQVRDRDHVMGEAVAQIQEEIDQRVEKLEQMQKDMQERLQVQMQERLDKIQEDMMENLIKAQKDAMAELTHLLTGRVDKGKGPMANPGEGNEDPLYPPGFTPPNVQAQTEIYPKGPPVIIRPQQLQTGVTIPTIFQGRSSLSPGENSINPIIPDFDEKAEEGKANAELPKQWEDRYKWLEEKIQSLGKH